MDFRSAIERVTPRTSDRLALEIFSMKDTESNKHCIIDISSSDESKSPPSDSDDDAVEEINSSTSWYFRSYIISLI